MATDSKLTLTDFLSKFIDVANLSKIVTDVGPGFLIGLSLLLLFNLMTDVPLLPFQRYGDIESRIGTTSQLTQTLDDRITNLRKERIQWQGRLAELNAAGDEKKNPALEKERAQITEQLSNSRQMETETKTRLEDAQKELTEHRSQLDAAGSLLNNLTLLEEHIVSVLFFSLILGVAFSQLAGQTFYNDFYRRRFYDQIAKVPADVLKYVKNDEGIPTDVTYFRGTSIYTEAKQKEYESLIRDYYRYQEVAMNMIVPVGLLAVALAAVSGVKISQGRSVYWVGALLALFLVAVAVQLFRAGYDYFWYFRVKTAYFIRALYEEKTKTTP